MNCISGANALMTYGRGFCASESMGFHTSAGLQVVIGVLEESNVLGKPFHILSKRHNVVL